MSEPVSVPPVEEVATKLGESLEEIRGAYLAEVADQAARCRVVPFNDALAAALVRRIKRARAMDNLPLGVMQDESGATRLGSSDPEVRRLEAPYRKSVLG